jgi:hypothetical protein
VDWGDVAVGVVVGLIVAAIIGGVRWYGRRRERQAKEAGAEYNRRAPVRVGGHIVADELRANAGLARQCEEGRSVATEVRKLVFVAWHDRRAEMLPLRTEDPALWGDLEAAYVALETSKSDGDWPPTEAGLLELADRLDKAAGD